MENETIFTGMTFTDEPDLVPEGTYEFVIDSADKTMSKSGTTDYLKLKLKIRADVNQGSKGRVLFVSVFRDKQNPAWYDYNTLSKIIVTQKPRTTVPGAPKWSVSFDTCDDCIQYLTGLKLKATVAHETYENADGEEVERAVVVRGSYKPTDFPETGVVKENTDKLEVADSDLPF